MEKPIAAMLRGWKWEGKHSEVRYVDKNLKSRIGWRGKPCGVEGAGIPKAKGAVQDLIGLW